MQKGESFFQIGLRVAAGYGLRVAGYEGTTGNSIRTVAA
jgi:hypothetical protein